MFAALEDLLYKKRHARDSKRVERTFPILYSPDNGHSWLPAYGLDMSLSGMKIFSRSPLPQGELPMRVSLDATVVDLRVKTVWHVEGRYKKEKAHEYGVQLVSANAGDRERIGRWLGGKPLEERNLASEELREIRLKPDDVDRLIPLAFQKRLFAELVSRARLAPVDATHPALVAYDYGGVVRYHGVPMHRLTIHSKVVGSEGDERYRTRVLFDDAGSRLVFPDETPPSTADSRAS